MQLNKQTRRTTSSWSALVGSAIVLLLPLTSSALGVSIANVSSTGASTSLLADGDVLTVDLVVENTGLLDIYGFGLTVAGWDSDANGVAAEGLDFSGASAASSIFNTVVIPGPPIAVLGGLTNSYTSPQLRGSPAVPDTPFPGDQSEPAVEIHAAIFGGVSLTAASGSGSDDLGVVLGDLVSNGDVHFRVQFTADAAATGQVAAKQFTLRFGDFISEAVTGTGGAALAFTDASLVVNVVPEPGTALLMGLGLLGLASRQR